MGGCWVTAPFLHLTLGFAGTADLGGNVSAFQKHRQGSGTANVPEPASPSPPSTHAHPETTLNTAVPVPTEEGDSLPRHTRPKSRCAERDPRGRAGKAASTWLQSPRREGGGVPPPPPTPT